MNLDHGERGDSAKMHCMHFRRVAAFAAVMLFAASSFAASVEQKKGELQDLKGRIKDLRRDVAAAEKSKTSVADQLRETESAISDTSRRLHQLSAESTEAKQQLASLDAQKRRLDQQAGTQQQQLAQVLNRQFVSNESDALKLLLSGHDPNQTARDRYFLTQLSRAKAELLKQLRTVAAEKKALAEDTRQRQAQLAAIERQQQESRAQLLARKKQRVATLAKIGDRLKAQRREIDSLKRDQQRLAKLISGLARAAAAKRAAPRDPPADDTKVGAGGTAIGNTSRIKSYEPGHVEGAFAALRGKLALPVKGQIVGRFGHTREAGGANWRGLFIRAPRASWSRPWPAVRWSFRIGCADSAIC